MAQFTQSDKDTLSSVYNYLNDDLSSLNNERKLIKNKLTHYLQEKEKTDSNIDKEEVNTKFNKYNEKFILINSKISKLTREVRKLGALIKSKTKSSKKVSKQSSINNYIEVPDEFANLVGVKKESITSLPNAVKAFWDYIKENNLFNKETKTVEINNEIRNLFNLKDDEIIQHHTMHRYINKLCTPVKVPIAYSYSVSSESSTPVHYWYGDY
jgi:chromatin remodeling complex protein RSC6